MSEERNAYHKRWREAKAIADPLYSHKKALKELYKTTEEWYEAKLQEQDGHCALCDAKQQTHKGSGKRLSVDHNHRCCPGKRTCGKCNRGLLCFNCNKLLGHLEMFLEQSTTLVPAWDTWLENALLYLTKYGCR
jgi:Recombination endonuclease VII